jgi:hypothetical protein
MRKLTLIYSLTYLVLVSINLDFNLFSWKYQDIIFLLFSPLIFNYAKSRI